MAALVTEVKPRQLAVVRLRQDEEESWISSEELYTDGSSDEDTLLRLTKPTATNESVDEASASFATSGTKHIHHHLHHQHHHHQHHHHRHHQSASAQVASPAAASVLSNPSPLSRDAGGLEPPSLPPPPPPTASEPVLQDAPHLTETTRRLSLLGVEEGDDKPPSATADGEEVEEQEDIMLWRPKRGSLKLPTLDLSASAVEIVCRVTDGADKGSTPVAAAATVNISTSSVAEIVSEAPTIITEKKSDGGGT